MNKLLLSIIVATGLSSCSFDFEDLKRPIVVIAIDTPSQNAQGSVILRDSEGYIWSKSTYASPEARAIISSYKTGDTLK